MSETDFNNIDYTDGINGMVEHWDVHDQMLAEEGVSQKRRDEWREFYIQVKKGLDDPSVPFPKLPGREERAQEYREYLAGPVTDPYKTVPWRVFLAAEDIEYGDLVHIDNDLMRRCTVEQLAEETVLPEVPGGSQEGSQEGRHPDTAGPLPLQE